MTDLSGSWAFRRVPFGSTSIWRGCPHSRSSRPRHTKWPCSSSRGSDRTVRRHHLRNACPAVPRCSRRDATPGERAPELPPALRRQPAGRLLGARARSGTDDAGHRPQAKRGRSGRTRARTLARPWLSQGVCRGRRRTVRTPWGLRHTRRPRRLHATRWPICRGPGPTYPRCRHDRRRRRVLRGTRGRDRLGPTARTESSNLLRLAALVASREGAIPGLGSV